MGVAVISDEHGNFYRVHRILMPDGSMFIYENKKTSAETAAAPTNNVVVASPTDADSTTTISQTPPDVKPDVVEPHLFTKTMESTLKGRGLQSLMI